MPHLLSCLQNQNDLCAATDDAVKLVKHWANKIEIEEEQLQVICEGSSLVY